MSAIFTVLRRLTVRREFTASRDPRAMNLRRDCGIGCTCAALIYTPEATAEAASLKSLCFNDRTQQGISELAGTAQRVEAPEGVTAFEVQANLVGVAPARRKPAARSSPDNNDPF